MSLKIFKKIKGYFLYFKSIYLQYIEIKYRQIQKKRLKNKDFTIISNNCWGGRIYEDMGLPYKSPTIGLFFFAPCYMKFVKDIRSAISLKLEFVDISRYEKAQSLRSKQWYPVGKLGDDIEIHFLHYESEAAAADKWNRRKLRINFDNLFISCSDSEGYNIESLKEFDNLPIPKVFFSSKKINGIKSLVWLKAYKNKNHIGDIYTFPWSYRLRFDVVKWLNNKV